MEGPEEGQLAGMAGDSEAGLVGTKDPWEQGVHVEVLSSRMRRDWLDKGESRSNNSGP